MKKCHNNHLQTSSPEASQSMSVLAGVMADDFKNILTVVLGACSLIDMDDPANAELQQCVALIRSSAERAALLAESLAAAGKATTDETSCVTNEIMESKVIS